MSNLQNSVRQTLLQLGRYRDVPDAELLQCFVTGQEEAAFAELVRRHGPLVLRVCRRVLHHAQDAEDAFQATFLVLSHKAPHIGNAGLLANWLYGVAYRTALHAKRQRALRQAASLSEQEDGPLDNNGRTGSDEDGDLQAHLDEVVARLPEPYRTAIVLSYFQGKTNEEAARLLGCPTGAFQKRLSRAREYLREGLTRRGVTVSGAMLGTLLAHEAQAQVPAALLAVTLAIPSGAPSSRASILATAVLGGMDCGKRRLILALVLVLAVLGSAWTLWRSGSTAPDAALQVVSGEVGVHYVFLGVTSKPVPGPFPNLPPNLKLTVTYRMDIYVDGQLVERGLLGLRQHSREFVPGTPAAEFDKWLASANTDPAAWKPLGRCYSQPVKRHVMVGWPDSYAHASVPSDRKVEFYWPDGQPPMNPRADSHE